ncbi:hypothetical protein Tco_0696397, partial [Tanacetum coccineum]
DYVSGPEYLEYLAPSDEEVPVEDQPYAVADSRGVHGAVRFG